jgi:hypothetical protein
MSGSPEKNDKPDLFAELHAAIDNFTFIPEQGEAAPAGPSAREVGAFPTIDPNAQRELKTASAAAPAQVEEAPAPLLGGGLLAELAAAAGAQSQASESDEARRLASARRLSKALQGIYGYLNQLAQHVNVLKPEVKRSYRLNAQCEFTGLRWDEAFANYRRAATATEEVLVSSVSFRLRYATAAVPGMTLTRAQAEALRRDLHLVDLAITEENTVAAADGPAVWLRLANSIPVQLGFTADTERDCIIVRGRNVEGFGLSAFKLDPAKVDQPLLDAIGLVLLGRANALPAALSPVPFNAPRT